MTKRWRVRKRDGVWVVLDQAGRLRYACADHFMALSFALMKSEHRLYPSAFQRLIAQRLQAQQREFWWSQSIQDWLKQSELEDDQDDE